MRSDISKSTWTLDQFAKSQFFHQKLHELGLLKIAYELENIKGEELEWDSESLNITTDAWKKVIHRGIKPIRVFAHPEVLRQNSKRTSYYRMLAMVSQKSMGNVGLNAKKYEDGRNYSSYDEALRISAHLNSIISTLVEYDEGIDDREFDLWRGMAAGSQAQGSWGNVKGEDAEVAIKELVEKRVKDKGLVVQEASHGKSKTLELNDGRILAFAPEPDIGIYEDEVDMLPEVAVEIKGGIDPAAALERFGASLKSLRRIKQENENSITILMMQTAAITSRVKEEIGNSKSTIDYFFEIEQLEKSEGVKEQLFGIMRI